MAYATREFLFIAAETGVLVFLYVLWYYYSVRKTLEIRIVVKIIVNSVTTSGSNLEIVFGNCRVGSPEWQRALRILWKHAVGGYSARGNWLRLGGGACDKSAINTLAACQAQMDKWANVKMSVSFGQPEVRIWGKNDKLKTALQVKEAREAGKIINVKFTVTLNLPMIHDDHDRLRKALPWQVEWGELNSNPSNLSFSFSMNEKLADKDPWQVVKELQPKIRNAFS